MYPPPVIHSVQYQSKLTDYLNCRRMPEGNLRSLNLWSEYADVRQLRDAFALHITCQPHLWTLFLDTAIAPHNIGQSSYTFGTLRKDLD